MIHPVPPVGWGIALPTWRVLADLHVRYYLLPGWARIPRYAQALPPGLYPESEGVPLRDALIPDAFIPDFLRDPSDRVRSSRMLRWQPWPAYEPYIDRPTRWWPSDDFPPEEPEVVIEDKIPDKLTDIVLWPAYGGLLDVFV